MKGAGGKPIPAPDRGEVWYVNLDPVKGREQGMTRPAVIVSNDLFNHGPSELATVVSVTTSVRPMRMRIRIDPPEGGLTEPSDILVDQVRTISRERLVGSAVGRVSPQTMKEIEDRLRILIDL